jgi:hypothetical protein
MSETKTVQRQIRPITIRCGSPGCTSKPVDAVLEEHEGADSEVIAPRGWTFPPKPKGKGKDDVFVGTCPAHATAKK